MLELYKYIELINPVQAEMVTDPGEYRWSSYQANGLGKISDLCTPHQEYLALGNDIAGRQNNYRQLFTYDVEGELLREITKSGGIDKVIPPKKSSTRK